MYLFTDGDVIEFNKIFDGCCVTFIYVKTRKLKWEEGKIIRFKLYSYFLNSIPKEYVHRVLYADLFDTVFQGDPFSQLYTKESFVMSYEGPEIEQAEWSRVRFNNNFYAWISI